MLAKAHTIKRAIERTQREAEQPQRVWGLMYFDTFDCTHYEAVMGAKKRLRILQDALTRQRLRSYDS
jgi:hypothetical protein